jgi:hypothetical protein
MESGIPVEAEEIGNHDGFPEGLRHQAICLCPT